MCELIQQNIFIFYLTYFLLVGIASYNGLFINNTMPPRIVVFSALPLFLFYMLVVRRKKWFKEAVQRVDLEALVVIHLFRFVGVYFLVLHAYEALPFTFAMIGGWGDILTATLALPLLLLLRKKSALAIPFAWIWNIIGLLDILSVLSTAIITTNMAIQSQEAGVQPIRHFSL